MKTTALMVTGLLFVVSVLTAACGGGGPTTANQPAPASAEVVPIQGTPTAVTIRALRSATGGDALKFDLDTLTAKAGSRVMLTFDNASSVSEHNWLLVQPGTSDSVAVAGIAAGAENSYVPPGDERVLAYIPLLDPETTGEVQFVAPAAGTYEFVCTVPGHQFTMLGDFIVTP